MSVFLATCGRLHLLSSLRTRDASLTVSFGLTNAMTLSPQSVRELSRPISRFLSFVIAIRFFRTNEIKESSTPKHLWCRVPFARQKCFLAWFYTGLMVASGLRFVLLHPTRIKQARNVPPPIGASIRILRIHGQVSKTGRSSSVLDTCHLHILQEAQSAHASACRSRRSTIIYSTSIPIRTICLCERDEIFAAYGRSTRCLESHESVLLHKYAQTVTNSSTAFRYVEEHDAPSSVPAFWLCPLPFRMDSRASNRSPVSVTRAYRFPPRSQML